MHRFYFAACSFVFCCQTLATPMKTSGPCIGWIISVDQKNNYSAHDVISKASWPQCGNLMAPHSGSGPLNYIIIDPSAFYWHSSLPSGWVIPYLTLKVSLVLENGRSHLAIRKLGYRFFLRIIPRRVTQTKLSLPNLWNDAPDMLLINLFFL